MLFFGSNPCDSGSFGSLGMTLEERTPSYEPVVLLWSSCKDSWIGAVETLHEIGELVVHGIRVTPKLFCVIGVVNGHLGGGGPKLEPTILASTVPLVPVEENSLEVWEMGEGLWNGSHQIVT